MILETETGLARIGMPVRLLLDDPRQCLDGLIWDATVCAQNRLKVVFFNNTETYHPAATVWMKVEPYPRPLFLGVKLDDLPKEIF